MQRRYRLTGNAQFKEVYSRGRSYVGYYLVLYVKENQSDQTRIGFTVSKKIGKAVVRNRIKRKLREVCRLNLDRFAKGYDIIFVARKKIKGIRYHLVEQEIEKLCTRAGLWR
ncbi:MAG TPA: ribonuclease P protein component [Clostridia bacterium]|nr:ribonuclease P protein component [Clostridia bacterium]